MAKKAQCVYCYGHGIYAGYWDRGMRRVMERGPYNTPQWPNERRYACDRCHLPANLEKPPAPHTFATS